MTHEDALELIRAIKDVTLGLSYSNLWLFFITALLFYRWKP